MNPEMNNLIIQATKSTPKIEFNCNDNILEIIGESYPENIAEFYAPVFEWIEQYLNQLENQQVFINIDLIYFNTGSSKILLDLFDMLDNAAMHGKRIVVNWIYQKDDEDALEFGEEFQSDLKFLQFNLVQKETARGEENAF